jgi:hypothetical protein
MREVESLLEVMKPELAFRRTLPSIVLMRMPCAWRSYVGICTVALLLMRQVSCSAKILRLEVAADSCLDAQPSVQTFERGLDSSRWTQRGLALCSAHRAMW